MAGIKKKKEFLTSRKAKTKTKMSTTIEDIRKAKEVAKSEINLIVKKFAEEYNLQNISVDVSINRHYSENDAVMAINVKTEIKVQI